MNSNSTLAGGAPPTKCRRRWPYWLLAFLLLMLILVWLLPYFASLPVFRERWLAWASNRLHLKITTGDLSFGWFSPIVASDVKIQNADDRQAVLSLPLVEGNLPLWRLVTGHDSGTFRLSEPELNLEFDQQGNNLARLLDVLGHSAVFGGRRCRFTIEKGKFSLRGSDSPKAWTIENVALDLTVTPAATSKLGVPVLSGSGTQILNQTELTPEMCNDLLRYIAPILSLPTSVNGRVSLELSNFSWPIGKAVAADATGTLTLHRVDVGPGQIFQVLAVFFPKLGAIPAFRVAQDDTVPFHLHDGRVDHDNLVFGGLPQSQSDFVVRAHGSVGLDQTLDWYLDFPSSAAAALPSGEGSGKSAIRALLNQLELHITGTLSSPKIAVPTIR